MAQYNNHSPWYKTDITKNYLDTLTIRPVSAEPDGATVFEKTIIPLL